ncbi:MAG: WYL domain-containing protein [Microthrixaceae bacterium]|nr:WYL domain-containing protein [Microthrixaceae bacterium]HPB45423.1 WYL domain-containing protein [Microthrixaceae bacterium]
MAATDSTSSGISKLERLLNLTALLLATRRPLTVEQIGEQIAGYPAEPMSFRRQFERDKDELRQAGVPLELVTLSEWDEREVGYRIPPELYYLPDPELDPDERAALQFAMDAISLRGLEGSQRSDAGLKLELPPSEAMAPMADVSVSAEVGVLREAISSGQVVRFAYRSAMRTVEPHRLDYQNGRWYLTGRDLDKEAIRSFRVDRFDGSVDPGTPGSFEAPTSTRALRLEPWRFGDDPPTAVTLQIDRDHAPVVRDSFGPDAEWTERADGDVEVRCVVSGRRAFRTLVLSMLDHAVIVEPADVRDEFVTYLEGLAR